MTARTPHGRALDELLADGHWHDLEDVIRRVAAAVPPGQAHRRTTTERARRDHERRSAGTPAAPTQSRARDAINVGARDLARRLIDSRITRGTIQRDHQQIRQRPHPPAG